MVSKLPQWVGWGGLVLTLVAGMVNAAAFWGFQHQAVSHITGTVTQFGIALVKLDYPLGVHYAAVVGSFFLGALLSGLIIRDSVLQMGRRYGVVLLVEAAFLALSFLFLQQQMAVGDYLASASCGLQNAMATTYSGANIRTTHMSGVVTDLGIWVGHWLRGVKVEGRRAKLYGILLFGFVCGSLLGSYGFLRMGYGILLVPSALCASAGAGYLVWRSRRSRTPLLKK